MKVLWLSNVLFPEVCKEINVATPVVGGWMHSGALNLIACNTNIKLAVATLYSGKKLICIDQYAITYYLIPDQGGNQNYNKELEEYYKAITNIFIPDVVHIHGSEYPHTLAYVKACGVKRVIVSIQGLVSIISKYYLGGIPIPQIKNNTTLRDLLRQDTLLIQQEKMRKRGVYEMQLLQSVNHIIGRTSWDQSNVWAINPTANYYFCNETLRAQFYKHQWEYEKCKKYSIFLSQAHYPIKGIQKIIEALPIILKHYPLTQVYVAGNDFINVPWYRKNGFANYLEKLMMKFQVHHHITFLGVLSESEMVNQYLSANVFVCPSAIENSPNSVAEAQLIGTPCVASYVGGTMDMIQDNETGLLYRFEETALLAKHICTIFANKDLAEYISANARKTAFVRHDKDNNASRMNEIYNKIINEDVSNL